jgi:hypothetical protein
MKQKKYTQEERINKLEQVVALLYTYHQTMVKEIQSLKAELNAGIK